MNLATWDPGRELRADGSHRIEQPQAGQQWRIHLAELVLWNGQLVKTWGSRSWRSKPTWGTANRYQASFSWLG